jgi:hypothetical protein
MADGKGKRKPGTVVVGVGEFDVEKQMWFDFRLCDMGVVVSFCDNQRNFRATVVIDEGKVVYRDKGLLIRDRKSGRK